MMRTAMRTAMHIACEPQCTSHAEDRGQRTEDRGQRFSLRSNRLPPSLRSVAFDNPCRTRRYPRTQPKSATKPQTARAVWSQEQPTMITTIVIDRPITRLPAEQQQPWWDWCTRMGIDPKRVELYIIELDDQARTIGYTHRDGYDQARREWIHHWHTVQLEAPALTPPPGYRTITCQCTEAGDRDHQGCAS